MNNYDNLKNERKAYLTKQLRKWLLDAEYWGEENQDDYEYCLANAIKVAAELDKLQQR